MCLKEYNNSNNAKVYLHSTMHGAYDTYGFKNKHGFGNLAIKNIKCSNESLPH